MIPHLDPIAAVTAGDPGPTYGELLQHARLIWDDQHGFWIAARPEMVRAVLDHKDCHARPALEPVPARLVGTAAGDIFAHFVRMRDGEIDSSTRRAVSTTLAAVDVDDLRSTTARLMQPIAISGDLERACWDVPVQVVGSMLGVPDATLEEIPAWTRAFVRCTVPAATRSDIQQGITAAERLWVTFADLVEQPEAPGLMETMRRAFAEMHLGADATVANAIGLLFQTHDAMAGLIGNTVAHLSRRPGSIGEQAESLVRHVARHDPPVQNTRRFVVRDTTIGWQSIRAGDTILVVLAAAGMAEPEHDWTFGHGRHECPGRAIASAIAAVAVDALMRHEAIPAHLPDPLNYHPMANVRVPAFRAMCEEPPS